MSLVAVLDFETTDIQPANGAVIEGAVCLVQVDPQGIFGETVDSYTSFNDPGAPIPKEITKLTGIDDAMVKGIDLDWKRFNGILSRASLLIAHNASFDRGWLEHHGKHFSTNWACTLRMIDWSESHGMPCRTLKHLAWEHDHFPNAHRAMDDVQTLLYLLRQPSKGNLSRTYGQELLATAALKKRLVLALQSPFETKDLLKDRGFRWSPERKVWWKLVPESEMAEMESFMKEKIYRGPCRHSVSEPVDTLDPSFKTRYGLG